MTQEATNEIGREEKLKSLALPRPHYRKTRNTRHIKTAIKKNKKHKRHNTHKEDIKTVAAKSIIDNPE